MAKLNFDKAAEDPDDKFEVTVVVRDKNGNPTGKTKTFSSERCSDVSNWYNQQKKQKRKRSKKNKNRNG